MGTVNMAVDFGGVKMQNPINTAAGTFGYGWQVQNFFDVSQLGAITTKGCAAEPWPGNPAPRMAEIPGGMINSVGHHKGAWSLCGGWRLSGGESWRVSRLLRLDAGVAPDDLDDVTEHKDKGHAADEVTYEGKPREGACDYAAHGCHGVAVLVVSNHAGDRAPRKGTRHQRDADNAAQEGSGKRQTSDRDNQQ